MVGQHLPPATAAVEADWVGQAGDEQVVAAAIQRHHLHVGDSIVLAGVEQVSAVGWPQWSAVNSLTGVGQGAAFAGLRRLVGVERPGQPAGGRPVHVDEPAFPQGAGRKELPQLALGEGDGFQSAILSHTSHSHRASESLSNRAASAGSSSSRARAVHWVNVGISASAAGVGGTHAANRSVSRMPAPNMVVRFIVKSR
ncbi:MAG: hypothetical protein SWK90_03730 [Chloroflexota bacterium]|nr:hypothetical protein [Chloroflexota bacterium]